MHVGETRGPDCARPLLRFADGRLDGAVSESGQIAGAYVHGLFADDRQRAPWLAALGTTTGLSYEATIERTLDALADHCEAHLDCDALLAVCPISDAMSKPAKARCEYPRSRRVSPTKPHRPATGSAWRRDRRRPS